MDLIHGHDDEAGINRRLNLYRETNEAGKDASVSAWEDSKVPLHKIVVDGKADADVALEIMSTCGEPRNYGLTDFEKRAIKEAKALKERYEQALKELPKKGRAR